MTPEALTRLADRFSRALDALERRSRRSIVAVLRHSLAVTMGGLRRAYLAYVGALGPVGYDPARNPIRRPEGYNTTEAAARFATIVEASRAFLTDLEVQQITVGHERHLREAAALGGQLSARMLPGAPVIPPDAALLRAASQNVGALIRGEGARFREQLVGIVGEAATRGWGPKRLEVQVRRAMQGTGQRRGMEQRAAVIARTELARVYAEASLNRARDRGDSFVRILASNDERVCPTCAARNGRVFPTDRVTLPWHPRCRCVAVPVPNEAIQERDPDTQDVLLDSERWRAEHERGVLAYAEGLQQRELEGLRGQRQRLSDPALIEAMDRRIEEVERRGPDMAKARSNLARALRTPTAAEKALYPTNPTPLGESVPLFR